MPDIPVDNPVQYIEHGRQKNMHVPPMECPTQMTGLSPTPASNSFSIISSLLADSVRLAGKKDKTERFANNCQNVLLSQHKADLNRTGATTTVQTLPYLSLSWGHFGAHSDRCVSYSTVNTLKWGQSSGNQSCQNISSFISVSKHTPHLLQKTSKGSSGRTHLWPTVCVVTGIFGWARNTLCMFFSAVGCSAVIFCGKRAVLVPFLFLCWLQVAAVEKRTVFTEEKLFGMMQLFSTVHVGKNPGEVFAHGCTLFVCSISGGLAWSACLHVLQGPPNNPWTNTTSAYTGSLRMRHRVHSEATFNKSEVRFLKSDTFYTVKGCCKTPKESILHWNVWKYLGKLHVNRYNDWIRQLWHSVWVPQF